jgi:hypothetical protein
MSASLQKATSMANGQRSLPLLLCCYKASVSNQLPVSGMQNDI